MADQTWTPEQFFEFLSGYVGEHECGQIKDMLKEHGLAVAPALGDTHVVVPREPTPAMICAAVHSPQHGLLADFFAVDAWKAMIAAATGSQE